MIKLTNIQKKSVKAIFLIASGLLFLTCCSIEYWLQDTDFNDIANQSVGNEKNVILTADGTGQLESDDGEFPTSLSLNPDDGQTLTNGAPGTQESAITPTSRPTTTTSRPTNTVSKPTTIYSCSLPKPTYPTKPTEPQSPSQPSDPCAWYHRLSAQEKQEFQVCVTPSSYQRAMTTYNNAMRQYRRNMEAYRASSEYQAYQDALAKSREDYKLYKESCQNRPI